MQKSISEWAFFPWLPMVLFSMESKTIKRQQEWPFLGSLLGLFLILQGDFYLQMGNLEKLKCHLEHLQLPHGRVCSPVSLYKHISTDFSYSWEILSNSNTFQSGWQRGSLKLNTRMCYYMWHFSQTLCLEYFEYWMRLMGPSAQGINLVHATSAVTASRAAPGRGSAEDQLQASAFE